MTRWERVVIGLLCTLLPAGLVMARPVDWLDPAQGRFLDEWAEIYMAGSKVGYMHSTLEREGDLITTNSDSKIRLGRVDSPVEIRIRQTTTETLDGRPVAFGSEMDASLMKTSTKGMVEDGRVTIVTSQYGHEQKQVYDYPKGALMTWGMAREGFIRGYEPGTKYTLEAYQPELRQDGVVRVTTGIGEWETFTHAGKEMRGQRTVVVMESPIGTIESISWVDENRRPVKAKIPVPGLGDMVMITADQATAMADFVPPEIFMKTAIPVAKPIDVKRARRVVYRIRSKAEGVDLTTIPETGMQKVLKQAPEAVELEVSRFRHTGDNAGGLNRLGSDELAEYLEPNLMINTSDPELVKLAERAGAGESDPYALADKLRRFATDFVESKTLNIGFATASEVCRTREGDCSEHGVLLAALGRLNGLPSRVAVGLAYVPSFGNQEHLFGYHMWTQFYIDGRWIDVDAALRETVCSPTRIAFATSSLRSTGLADLSLPLLSKIGAIDIDILEIEYENP
jgi:hypothetical protein